MNKISTINLTDRQLQILKYLEDGKTDKEIAELLFTSHHNVTKIIGNLLVTLNCRNRTNLIAHFLRQNILKE